MPRNVTITFADGSKRVYNGVPDNVTPDQIKQRATTDAPDKALKAIDGGKSAQAAAPAKRRSARDYASMGGRGLLEVAGDYLGLSARAASPIVNMLPGVPELITAGGTYAADKLGLAKPETGNEKLGSAIFKGAASAAAPVGGITATGGRLAKNAITQLTSGALAGGAGELTRQAGGGTAAQIAASLLGGVTPFTAGVGIRQGAGKLKTYFDSGGTRAAARISDVAHDKPAAIGAIAARKPASTSTQPTVAEVAKDPGIAAFQRSRTTTRVAERNRLNAEQRGQNLDDAFGTGDTQAVQTRAQRRTEANALTVSEARTKVGPQVDRLDSGASVREQYTTAHDAFKVKTRAAYNDPALTTPVPVPVGLKVLEDMRDKANQFYGDGGGLMPASVQETLRDLMTAIGDDTVTTRTISNIDRRLADFAGQAKVQGKRAEATFANSLRDDLDRHTRDLTPPEFQTALGTARDIRLEQGKLFEQGSVARAMGEKKFGEPLVADTEIPGRIVRSGPAGGTAADYITGAIGPTAAESVAREELRRLVDAGKLDTPSAAGNFSELLKRFPGLQKDVAAVREKIALNNSFAESELGKLADSAVDPSEHITKLFQTRDGGRSVRRFIDDLKSTGDGDALNGFKRTMANYVKSAATTGVKKNADGVQIPDTDGAIAAVDNVLKYAKDTLSNPQRNALAVIREEMASANYAKHAGEFKTPYFDKTIPFVGSVVARTIKGVFSHINNNHKVDALLEKAILDPDFARELLLRPTPERLKKIKNAIVKSSIGATAGSMQSLENRGYE